MEQLRAGALPAFAACRPSSLARHQELPASIYGETAAAKAKEAARLSVDERSRAWAAQRDAAVAEKAEARRAAELEGHTFRPAIKTSGYGRYEDSHAAAAEPASGRDGGCGGGAGSPETFASGASGGVGRSGGGGSGGDGGGFDDSVATLGGLGMARAPTGRVSATERLYHNSKVGKEQLVSLV